MPAASDLARFASIISGTNSTALSSKTAVTRITSRVRIWIPPIRLDKDQEDVRHLNAITVEKGRARKTGTLCLLSVFVAIYDPR